MAEVYPTAQGGSAPRSSSVDKTSADVIGGGSTIAALCGLGAAVLGILGLSHVLPIDLCAVGILAAGAGMVFEGGAIAARFERMKATIATQEGESGEREMEVGITAEMVGGIGAIVLGILALIHIATFTLLPVSVIVIGATLLLGSGGSYSTIDLPAQRSESPRTTGMVHRAAQGVAGVDALLGIAAVTLGILGVIGIGQGGGLPILSLSAVLVVGVAELLADATLVGRMAHIFHHG